MRGLKLYGWVILGVAIITIVMLLLSCTIRKYEVKVYATEGATVTISPEILAEVPHTTSVQAEGELDLPDANVIGK